MGAEVVQAPLQARPQLATTARGLISETFNIQTLASSQAFTNQRVEAAMLGLRAGDVVANIVVCVLTAGAGTVPATLMKLALFKKDGTLCGATADNKASANWTTTGFQSFALTAAYTVPADDGYYAAVLQNGTWGTTAVAIARGVSNGVAGAAFGASPGSYVLQSAQADIPSPATFAIGSNALWFGVN